MAVQRRFKEVGRALKECQVFYKKFSSKVSRVFQKFQMNFCLFCKDLIAATRAEGGLVFSLKNIQRNNTSNLADISVTLE